MYMLHSRMQESGCICIHRHACECTRMQARPRSCSLKRADGWLAEWTGPWKSFPSRVFNGSLLADWPGRENTRSGQNSHVWWETRKWEKWDKAAVCHFTEKHPSWSHTCIPPPTPPPLSLLSWISGGQPSAKASSFHSSDNYEMVPFSERLQALPKKPPSSARSFAP